jgi:hypothetical protein
MILIGPLEIKLIWTCIKREVPSFSADPGSYAKPQPLFHNYKKRRLKKKKKKHKNYTFFS